jgi:hypothetical protein
VGFHWRDTKPDVFSIPVINRFSDKELGQGMLMAKEKSRTPSLGKQEKDAEPGGVECRRADSFCSIHAPSQFGSVLWARVPFFVLKLKP